MLAVGAQPVGDAGGAELSLSVMLAVGAQPVGDAGGAELSSLSVMLAVGAQPVGDAGGAELSSLSVIGWRSELSLSVMLAVRSSAASR